MSARHAVLVLSVLGGLQACYPRTEASVSTVVAGKRTYAFECYELEDCVETAAIACPYGYRLMGSGSVERLQPVGAVVGIALLVSGDQEGAHQVTEANKIHRTQLIVQCRSSDDSV